MPKDDPSLVETDSCRRDRSPEFAKVVQWELFSDADNQVEERDAEGKDAMPEFAVQLLAQELQLPAQELRRFLQS